MRTSLAIGLLVAATVGGALAGGCRASETGPGSGGSPTGTPTGTTTGTTTSVDPLPLKVATWNVHNLVDDQWNGAPDEWVENTAVWEAHREAVGQVLAAIDADLVVLQEVEHFGVLNELNTQDLASRYDELVLEEGNDPRGIDVGLMSKLPVDQVISHADDEFARVGTDAPLYRYSRDCLEVHLTFNGRPLALLAVHYKAKENDNPSKRLAEAQHTRAIADGITDGSPDTGVIILGDFNDTPGSTPYDWTIGIVQDHPIRYTNAPDSLPTTDRWTFDYQGTRELVDQQMSNPVLAEMLDQAAVEIWHTADVIAASDHHPVIATYQVR
ncbi:MAG: endonuclease/exonuclease/phosphatase family protein [Deltaproteobacteria bacterium]|jgi:endonuclease/exonuclease/phosphatase family metal-dependent hydrolase|nr:endonuclease/exonuclease/phosphatase family protein [Deltaproteobacteria bacterium]MBW2535958.1 endonuclease/exonuclease/phosphatase family protein [Deltaproteobacteria bacterium]